MPILIPNTTILAPHAIVPSTNLSLQGFSHELTLDNYGGLGGGSPGQPIAMYDLINGGNSHGSYYSYESINTSSPSYPNASTPHAFSEWVGYDHDYATSPSAYITAVHYLQDNGSYSTNHNVNSMTTTSSVNQYHSAQNRTMGAIKFVLNGSQPMSIKAQLTQGSCYYYSGQPYGYWFHWWAQGSEYTQSSSTALYAYIYTHTTYSCSPTTGGTYNWNTNYDFTISVSFKLRFTGLSVYTYRTAYMHLNTT